MKSATAATMTPCASDILSPRPATVTSFTAARSVGGIEVIQTIR